MEIFKDRKKIIEFTDKYCFGNVAVILRNYPDKLIMFGNSFVVANQSEPGSLDPEIDFWSVVEIKVTFLQIFFSNTSFKKQKYV